MAVGIWDALAIAAKSLTYATTLGAAGAVWFLRYCHGLLAAADRLRIRRFVLGSAVLSVFGGAAQLLIAAGSMSGTAAGMLDTSLLHLVWHAGAGRDNAIRAVGLLLAALGMLSNRPAWPALLGAALAATSYAWTGHARALDAALPPLLLGVHLLGVAFWVGALVPLLMVADNHDAARVAPATARFGAAALYVVAGMVAAAACLLSMLLGGFVQLWSSGYGRFVMLKLGLVALLLGLAAFNKWRLTPRLLAGNAAAVSGLRRSLRLELLLAALIVGVTAAMTTIGGPPALD